MVAAGDPISDAISRDKPAKCLYEVDQPIVIGICWELGWQLMPYQDAGNKVKSEQTNRKKNGKQFREVICVAMMKPAPVWNYFPSFFFLIFLFSTCMH